MSILSGGNTNRTRVFRKSLTVEQRFCVDFIPYVFTVSAPSILDKWYLTVQQGKYLTTIIKSYQTAVTKLLFYFH